MELTDSSEITTRSPLGIDLNEIPSSFSPLSAALPESESESDQPDPDPLELDSFDVVRSFHENQDPASGIAAGLPEEEKLSTCGSCGKPELGEHVVVCDGCERGVHLTCAGMNGRQVVNLVDWICAECVRCGAKSKRWPLGVKSKRILDINASPPSDCDGGGESSEEPVNLRKDSIDDNSSSGNAVGAPISYSNRLYAGNGFGPFDFKKGSGLMMKAFRVGFEDILHHAQTVDRSLEEIDLGFPLGRLRSSNRTAVRLPSQSHNEVLLHGLREFITERHGVLDEGWHVELKHCTSSYEVYAVYCSPDGKTFGSMSEVACYLGLPPNCNSMDTDARRDETPSVQEKLHLSKKRKAKRFSLANGFVANKQALVNGYQKGLMTNSQSAEIVDPKFGKFMEADAAEDDIAKSPASDDRLPVQFEDFFVISLGKIDVRPSYHDSQLIWPVGYKSCWHDKVTGSFFVCEVLDGGDSGPVFKVRRFSCSAMPIPDGSTVLYRKNSGLSADQNVKECNDTICFNRDCENDVIVEMILADASPPTEDDILNCLKHSSSETYGVQVSESLQVPSSSGNLSSCNLGLEDEIGEVSAEERSSSLAWRMVCQKLIEVYSEICNKRGSIKIYCKHVDNDMGSPAWDTKNKKTVVNFDSVAKFCSSPISADIPLEYQGEVDILAATLSKWLDQDRFGFDAHFVQEIIERLPGVDACSKYELLINRCNYSVSLTVGNGLLITKRKNGVDLDDSCRKSKRARQEEDDCETDDHNPPLGRLLCSKLPPILVGDLYQVWELLWRFYELLGLKEPLLLEKLEDELINPWFGGTKIPEDLERKVHVNQVIDLDRVDSMIGPVSCSYHESRESVHGDNSRVLLRGEKEVMNDSAQARLLSARIRCFGVALTKVHSSLLSVLIGELQSKVAAIVDPNFDSGESKSRRGRRKDVDSLTSMRQSKLTTLPINGLTWPELARRYILAFLSMDGNLDSAESTTRESVKVFRCLQGDGGVLCGSLAGVAGMEADALFLAEATKQIYGSLSKEKDVLTLEEEVTDANGSCEKNGVNDGNIPEWAQLLEPVRKLPTNVGTRIRKCVYEALEKGPPEWAKKRLEHSISKGVYKGNASGPTKKAVLSVLADVLNEGLAQKCEKRSKKKITIPVSEIIMKQCRIVLRQAAAADDAKGFCTLLGQNLITSCDHDDEGLLGSPAMVSRPLDFRTIDLRLAAGAYGGSHESFLEDIRELWNNVRTAFRDQPDMVELAETLSQNFESLYEKEVVTLVQKFEGYAKLDHLSAETKKELDDILASINEIPKAPWDEGVCKVCGVDKDDDSVLLCDTCDAEYHTYCLNPPLARIPEGNWYCPSCVSAPTVQEASSSTQVIGCTHSKKCQGENTHVHLETLMHLAVAMEEKDYWDFGIDERIFLLKFLCDELLNSALVRQHLDQCTETTAELQQKLRSLSVEWRNLRSKEEILAARAAKMDAGAMEEAKEGFGSVFTKPGKSMGQPPNLSDKCSPFFAGSDGGLKVDRSKKGTGTYGPDKHSPVAICEKKLTSDNQTINSMDTEGQVKELCGVVNGTNQENEKSSQRGDLSLSNELQQVTDQMGEIRGQSNLDECMERESSTFLPPPDHPGSSISSDMNIHVVENVPTLTVNESQVYYSELSAIKNDILRVQSLINSTESKLLKQSVRREFLGSDSRGCLYWTSATHGGHPRIIVDASLTLNREISDHRDPFEYGSVLQHSSSSRINTRLNLEGLTVCFPFLFGPSDAMAMSPWISYETEGEIEELIGWLGDNDQKERELKESILQWWKLRFQETQQSGDPFQEESLAYLSKITDNDKTSSSNCLVTKAALFLEKKYGTCTNLETTYLLKKRGKKTRGFTEEKMYRCYCLEPIWPSRHHCHSCHRTSSNDVEFEGHDDGRCNSVPSSCEKSEETNDSTRAKGNGKSEVIEKEYGHEMDKVQIANIGLSELGSRFIKFQNEGIECPYDFVEICSKFVTKDSNKELVEGIGLIGSNGIPSFVTSISPYLTSPEQDTTVQCDNLDVIDQQVFMQGNRNGSNACLPSLSDNSARKTAVNEISKLSKTNKPPFGCLHQKGRKSSFDKYFPEMRSISCCVVPQSSLKPLIGKVSPILRQLKINLLDMEAALPEEALRLSKGSLRRRWAWRVYVKSAESIYQMVQATIMLEEMIKAEYLQNEWWYWSSLSAAARTSTVSSLALRIYSLDASIVFEKTLSDSDPSDNLLPSSSSNQKLFTGLDSVDKCKVSRKSNKKRKEPEG